MEYSTRRTDLPDTHRTVNANSSETGGESRNIASRGFISADESCTSSSPVTILRDSAADISLVLKEAVPNPDCYTGEMEYGKLFSDVPRLCPLLEHDVETRDAQPVRQAPYRLNAEKRAFLQAEVQRLKEQGIIIPSLSPWASPVVLVPKSSGTYRLCVDYRKVNAVTVADSFPLPRMDDIIDDLGKARYLTKLDLLQGYYQVPLTFIENVKFRNMRVLRSASSHVPVGLEFLWCGFPSMFADPVLKPRPVSPKYAVSNRCRATSSSKNSRAADSQCSEEEADHKNQISLYRHLARFPMDGPVTGCSPREKPRVGRPRGIMGRAAREPVQGVLEGVASLETESRDP
ncbi:uncharacterized protein LOC119571769, partial [Penaeus monodon]|uniref:uncharacterized protein LOC119571769 n=1 Tax=Penaeus monodon TaxID=6687 RepID=UPI0018A6FFEE